MCDQCERYTKWDKFELDFEPKQYGDCDIDVKIDYCTVYESNVHAITLYSILPTLCWQVRAVTGGWGDVVLARIIISLLHIID